MIDYDFNVDMDRLFILMSRCEGVQLCNSALGYSQEWRIAKSTIFRWFFLNRFSPLWVGNPAMISHPSLSSYGCYTAKIDCILCRPTKINHLMLSLHECEGEEISLNITCLIFYYRCFINHISSPFLNLTFLWMGHRVELVVAWSMSFSFIGINHDEPIFPILDNFGDFNASKWIQSIS